MLCEMLYLEQSLDNIPEWTRNTLEWRRFTFISRSTQGIKQHMLDENKTEKSEISPMSFLTWDYKNPNAQHLEFYWDGAKGLGSRKLSVAHFFIAFSPPFLAIDTLKYIHIWRRSCLKMIVRHVNSNVWVFKLILIYL